MQRDSFVEVAKAYCEAPPKFIGRQIWVRWDARMVRLLNDRMEQIGCHTRLEPELVHSEVTGDSTRSAERLRSTDEARDEVASGGRTSLAFTVLMVGIPREEHSESQRP